MKKLLKKTLALCLLMLLIITMFSVTGISVFASNEFSEELVAGNFYYEIKDGEVVITHCDQSISGDVVIPATIEGYPVTTIGDSAFAGCENLKSVAIHDSITTIGDNAFAWCDSLESITVAEENEYYSSDEYGVLFNKDKTELVQYPAGRRYAHYIIPESVTSVEDNAFCSPTLYLSSIVIPESVVRFGECSTVFFAHVGYTGSPEMWERIDFVGDGFTHYFESWEREVHYNFNPEDIKIDSKPYKTIIECSCGTQNISLCSLCGCHDYTSGFRGFIMKIKLFFWQLFGINKYCDCGVAHY